MQLRWVHLPAASIQNLYLLKVLREHVMHVSSTRVPPHISFYLSPLFFLPWEGELLGPHE